MAPRFSMIFLTSRESQLDHKNINTPPPFILNFLFSVPGSVFISEFFILFSL